VSGLFLGTVFLDETVAPTDLAGMAVIALGLAAIDGRPFLWLRRIAA
jgi:drug/metabolite transporter (DMT)-like permease